MDPLHIVFFTHYLNEHEEVLQQTAQLLYGNNCYTIIPFSVQTDLGIQLKQLTRMALNQHQFQMCPHALRYILEAITAQTIHEYVQPKLEIKHGVIQEICGLAIYTFLNPPLGVNPDFIVMFKNPIKRKPGEGNMQMAARKRQINPENEGIYQGVLKSVSGDERVIIVPIHNNNQYCPSDIANFITEQIKDRLLRSKQE